MALKDATIAMISQSEGGGGTVTVVDMQAATSAALVAPAYWSTDPTGNDADFHKHRRAAVEDFVRSQSVSGKAETENESGVKGEFRGKDGLWIQAPVHLSSAGRLLVGSKRLTMA